MLKSTTKFDPYASDSEASLARLRGGSITYSETRIQLRNLLLGGVLLALLSSLYFGANLSPFLNTFVLLALLLLIAILVTQFATRLKAERNQVSVLSADLESSKARMQEMCRELQEHEERFERRVAEQTESLHKSLRVTQELKHKVEEALYSTMGASVAKLMIEKRLRSEKRRVSVLVADLKNFTKFSEERQPEVVITDLNRLFQEMENVLLSYHAHIDKYLGDGIIVEFGAPIDFQRHPLLAVLAGLRMQERLCAGNFPWKMRIGIASGEAIIGPIGCQRQSYTAIGDVVNLASRIQEICTPGRVTVDSSCYEKVSLFVDVRGKTVLSLGDSVDPQVTSRLSQYSHLLDRYPNDVELMKKVGLLSLEANFINQAYEQLSKAFRLDPGDEQVKLAYAETALKMSQLDTVSIRGRKNGVHLYEILGLKDPLGNGEKIPKKVYDRYREKVDTLTPYPEDLLLPVEAIDGSVGHSRVVGFLSYVIADGLGLSERKKGEILQAGYLADVGKARVPHYLLNRPRGLSREEFEEVTKHSRDSVHVLKEIGFKNGSLFDIITASHENFDGSGYPRGLAGEAIPLGARIIAVADSYDALTAWRPYRDPWDSRAALSEMERGTRRGKFDPKVMEALLKVLKT